MNGFYSEKSTKRYAANYAVRAMSALLSSLGGLVIVATAAAGVRGFTASASFTDLAKKCFPYPESIREYGGGKSSPEEYSEAVAEKLLSSAFFGGDALYFDLGQENTGSIAGDIQKLIPSPSTLSDPSSPESPVNPPVVSGKPSGGGLIPDGYDIYAYERPASAEMAALIPRDLSCVTTGMTYSNATGFDPDELSVPKVYPIKSRLKKDAPTLYDHSESRWDSRAFDSSSEVSEEDIEPLVLIYHTHGTESFAPEGASAVKRGENLRDADIEKNIVAVGKVMSDMLNDAGIPTLHCETMHDLASYRDSYNLSADTIRKCLARYPSIKYVFDVHRDAIITSSGDQIKPVCNVNGRLSAQVMLLVGTDEKGADHPDWTTNLSIAAEWQRRVSETAPNLMRPINLRGASFNEQYAPGSLLIEVGSAGNTLSEAKYAAKQLTDSLIEMIRDNSIADSKSETPPVSTDITTD